MPDSVNKEEVAETSPPVRRKRKEREGKKKGREKGEWRGREEKGKRERKG